MGSRALEWERTWYWRLVPRCRFVVGMMSSATSLAGHWVVSPASPALLALELAWPARELASLAPVVELVKAVAVW